MPAPRQHQTRPSSSPSRRDFSQRRSRLDRERRTVEAMITLYCGGHHGPTSGLCEDCQTLAAYARRRLAHCRFGPAKPTCARCPVHCYSPAMRERIRAVMRFAGPRMLFRHPGMAMGHLIDGLRRVR